MTASARQVRGPAVRERLLDTATDLFTEAGVRAVGVDEVVRRSGVAKATLYRWFPSKDALVIGVLQRRDVLFWSVWDEVAARTHAGPAEHLDAQLEWIENLARWPEYRGCPFINTAAEFDRLSEEIRAQCLAHEEELGRRLRTLTARITSTHSDQLADQLHLAIVGALATGGLYTDKGPANQLRTTGQVFVRAYQA